MFSESRMYHGRCYQCSQEVRNQSYLDTEGIYNEAGGEKAKENSMDGGFNRCI